MNWLSAMGDSVSSFFGDLDPAAAVNGLWDSLGAGSAAGGRGAPGVPAVSEPTPEAAPAWSPGNAWGQGQRQLRQYADDHTAKKGIAAAFAPWMAE